MKQGRQKDYKKGTRRHGKHQLPLKKFLRSRLGKQWDKVYSEICEVFTKGSVERQELESSLKWYVERKCWKGAETGKIYDSEGHQLSGTFYVHPLSGCLEYANKIVRPRGPEKPLDFIAINDKEGYKKIKGCWFRVTYTENKYYHPWRANDPGLSKYDREMYGTKYFVENKKQLNAKELKELGFTNDPASSADEGTEGTSSKQV